jgi:GTPase SAR1 family protein
MINTRKSDFKLVIIGDCYIGKTTLLRKYIGKMDLGKSPFEIHEIDRHGEKIFLEIHDTNGNL